MKLAIGQFGEKLVKVEAKDYIKGTLKPRLFYVETKGNLPETDKMNAGYFDPLVVLFELEAHFEKTGDIEKLVVVSRRLDRAKLAQQGIDLRPKTPAPTAPAKSAPAAVGSRDEQFSL